MFNFIKKYISLLNRKYISYTAMKEWRAYKKSHKDVVIDESFYLTKDEKRQIKETWPGFSYCWNEKFWPRIFKHEWGFSPYFVGQYIRTDYLQLLNPKIEVTAFSNKAMCDIYFPDIKFPKTFVRYIKDNFYDLEMNHITTEQAIEILAASKEYIIKPALDSFGGVGVHKVTLSEDKNAAITQIKESFAQQPSDFITQEVIKQHPDIARLSPNCFNCFRITTIYINGKFDYAAMIKIGKDIKDNFRDNWNVSYLVGMSKDGVLNDSGYDNKFNKVYQTDNGIKFGGLQMPMFKELIDTCEKFHKHYVPNCGILGFDISIDDQNQVRVIEINMKGPGIMGEQLVSGPFLKPFRDDIVNRYWGRSNTK